MMKGSTSSLARSKSSLLTANACVSVAALRRTAAISVTFILFSHDAGTNAFRLALGSERLWCHTVPAFECTMAVGGLRVAKKKGNFANRQSRFGDVSPGSF